MKLDILLSVLAAAAAVSFAAPVDVQEGAHTEVLKRSYHGGDPPPHNINVVEPHSDALKRSYHGGDPPPHNINVEEPHSDALKRSYHGGDPPPGRINVVEPDRNGGPQPGPKPSGSAISDVLKRAHGSGPQPGPHAQVL